MLHMKDSLTAVKNVQVIAPLVPKAPFLHWPQRKHQVLIVLRQGPSVSWTFRYYGGITISVASFVTLGEHFVLESTHKELIVLYAKDFTLKPQRIFQ